MFHFKAFVKTDERQHVNRIYSPKNIIVNYYNNRKLFKLFL